MTKKKVCIFTDSRAEYGLLRWLMDEIKKDDQLKLQLVVTGSHLSEEHGMTYKEIEQDGYTIDSKIKIRSSFDDKSALARSVGDCVVGLADSLSVLKPDVMVILGDRYELLAASNVALLMNIPLAHISGGDITLGAIDNEIRNSITMMADYHFPGCEESAEKISRMIGKKENIFMVGEIGVDSAMKTPVIERSVLASSFNLDANKEWGLFTYHPETRGSTGLDIERVDNMLDVLSGNKGYQVVITGSNADFGGDIINAHVQKRILSFADGQFRYVTSLGQLNYINIMRNASFMIGNSSSGFFEAPSFKLPVINVGNRQKGRPLTDNMIQVDGSKASLMHAVSLLGDKSFIKRAKKVTSPYGDGTASIKMKNILKDVLNK